MSTNIDTKRSPLSTDTLPIPRIAVRTISALTFTTGRAVLTTLTLRNTTFVCCRVSYVTTEPLPSCKSPIKLTVAALASSPLRITATAFRTAIAVIVRLV